MSNPKRAGRDTPATAESRQPVAVGDVVMYNHVSREGVTPTPMMVTRTYSGTVVDGVAYSCDQYIFPNGTCKRIFNVSEGVEANNWQRRQ